MRRWLAAQIALLAIVALPLGATQARAAADSTHSDVTVWLMTFGQGDEVWELFGHNAIRIRDESRGTDIAYNWGMFSFADPDFLVRFLTGDTRYWMAGYRTDDMIAAYRQLDRSIWMQRLALTPAEAIALRDYIDWNALDENKFYRYDYFLDNCSTRVRDAIDRATGGALRRSLGGQATGTTFRWHTRRLTQRDVPTYTGIEIALGEPADRPITAWEEGFLPVRLQEQLRTVRVKDAAGREVPLVAEEEQVFAASRAAEPERPPRYLAAYLAVGLAIGLGLAALARGVGREATRGRARGFLVAATVWALVLGVLGVVLLVAWTATRHVFWARNENLLQLSPLLLLVALTLPFVGRGGAVRTIAIRAAAAVAALSVLGLALKLLPTLGQVNGEIIALVLPANLALAWGVRRVAIRPPLRR